MKSSVVFNSKVKFGRPLINGISTLVLKERFVCGASIDELVQDYENLTAADVEEALRFELLYRYQDDQNEPK